MRSSITARNPLASIRVTVRQNSKADRRAAYRALEFVESRPISAAWYCVVPRQAIKCGHCFHPSVSAIVAKQAPSGVLFLKAHVLFHSQDMRRLVILPCGNLFSDCLGQAAATNTDLKISHHSSRANCPLAEYVGPKMKDITHEISAAAANSASAPKPLVHRIWPQALVGVGLGVTVARTCILAYGFVRLVDLLI